MNSEAIAARLKDLSPDVPWAHLFEFCPGVFSVTPDNEKFYKKARGLSLIGETLTTLAEGQVKGHSLKGKRVVDLACGEGGHSVQFARRGANVTGIEGRKLYVDRATFAAEATGQTNIKFIQGDVRKLDPALGTFDVVMFSGILHHLGLDDFDGIIKELGRITDDILLVYTHVSNDLSIKKHRLEGPVHTAAGREGYKFREHNDNATPEQREQKVRASIDNTFSFWAREEVLIKALEDAGFNTILKVMKPHFFDWENAGYRPILIAKK